MLSWAWDASSLVSCPLRLCASGCRQRTTHCRRFHRRKAVCFRTFLTCDIGDGILRSMLHPYTTIGLKIARWGFSVLSLGQEGDYRKPWRKFSADLPRQSDVRAQKVKQLYFWVLFHVAKSECAECVVSTGPFPRRSHSIY